MSGMNGEKIGKAGPEKPDAAMKEKMRGWVAAVEKKLGELVPVRDVPQKNLYEAMRYSLLAGGKRIRPVLALAMGELLGADEADILPFACGLEMIHTYSLIHDDLPAMDNDDLRRGRPTCHKQFNEALAILAGDALLNGAFEVMSDYALTMRDVAAGLRIIRAVSALSGAEGMIGGQVTDLESEGKPARKALLLHTYRCKTGALLKAPAYIAIEAARGKNGESPSGGLAEASAAAGGRREDSYTEREKALLRYAEAVGLAFQIKDDILDIEGNTEELGKPVGSDEEQNKMTYVAVFGLAESRKALEEKTEEALAIAEGFGEEGAFLKFLARFLLERSY